MDKAISNTLKDNNSLEESKDEVLKSIGRNMLLFQQMEQVLKGIISLSDIAGYQSEFKQAQEKKTEWAKKQTMGTLVKHYIDNNDPDKEENKEPEVLKEPYISQSFYIETDQNSHNKQKAHIASLVEERNNLIHHFLPTFDYTSFDSCKKAKDKLDKQASKIRLEIKNLHVMLECILEGRKEIADFLASDEGKKQLTLNFVHRNSLTDKLLEICETESNDEGWMPLNKAINIINNNHTDELKNIKEKYGTKSLKKIMMKAELFEFKNEATPKGGSRVLYKTNQG